MNLQKSKALFKDYLEYNLKLVYFECVSYKTYSYATI